MRTTPIKGKMGRGGEGRGGEGRGGEGRGGEGRGGEGEGRRRGRGRGGGGGGGGEGVSPLPPQDTGVAKRGYLASQASQRILMSPITGANNHKKNVLNAHLNDMPVVGNLAAIVVYSKL